MPSVVVHCKLQLIKDCFQKLGEEIQPELDRPISVIGEELFIAGYRGSGRPSFAAPAILFACEFRPYLIHFYQQHDLKGILLGKYSADDFREAIHTVAGNSHFLRPDLLKSMYQLDLSAAYAKVESLTKTEREVAGLILDGLDNEAVAAEIGCKRRTAESHKYRIYKKLHVDSAIRLQLFVRDYCPWLFSH